MAIAARGLPARTALLAGPVLATVGPGALIVAGAQHSVPLFVLSSAVGGAGYALLFSGGLGAVTRSAPPGHRALVLSAAYVVGYVPQAGTALGLGELTRRADLESALEVGVPVVLAIGYAAALLVRHPPSVVGVTDGRPGDLAAAGKATMISSDRPLRPRRPARTRRT